MRERHECNSVDDDDSYYHDSAIEKS